MTELTEQQRAAVEPNGLSTALSAGAGCGKTKVLTERFLWHLAPGPEQVAIGRMAALTFTERAAREMRDRIRGRCNERLLDCAEADVRHWQGVLRDLETARISTIHAFCTRVLKAHAVQAGVDPQFRVLDESEAGAILHKVVEQALYELLARHDADAEQAVLRFGVGYVERGLFQLVQDCDPDAASRWRDTSPEQLAEHWRNQWHAEGMPRAAVQLAKAAGTRRLLDLLGRSEISHATMQQRRDWLLKHVPELGDTANVVTQLEQVHAHARVQNGGDAKAWPTSDVYTEAKDLLADLRKSAKGILDVGKRQGDSGIEAAAAHGLCVLHLAEHVLEAYGKAKEKAAALDFRDLLHKTHALLAGDAPARMQLAAGLEQILVDEFQDTDPVQVEILRSLCGEKLTTGKLFLVGDRKQSIYRFRQADPRLFERLRNEIPEDGRKSITKNFRSRPAILQFVNTLFAPHFGASYEPLVPHVELAAAAPAIEFLWTAINDPELPKEQCRRREAACIARRIAEMLRSGEPRVLDRDVGHGQRAPAPGDIAMLFRTLSSVRHYEEALRREGLDYYLVGGFGFYAQQEIWDLLNLLRALESPDDAASLAGALRSPLFSLRDETLYWLCAGRGDLAGGLEDSARWEPLDDGQRRRVAFAAQVLADLRAVKDRLPLAELLRQIVSRTGFDASLVAEFLGRRKLANLGKIRGLAREFDASGLLTLPDFITHLADFVARQPREDQAATHPEKSNVIRLMTIHQAKGLEFPIVFVPDLDRRDVYGPRGDVLHAQLGPLVRVPGAEAAHLGRETYRYLERQEEEEEHVRLLYVACTRPVDHLVLSASIEDLERPRSQWMGLLSARFDLQTGMGARPAAGTEPAPAIQITFDSELGTAGPGALRAATDWRKVVQRVRAARRDWNEMGEVQAAGKLLKKGDRHLASERTVDERLGGSEPVPVFQGRRQFSPSALTGEERPRLEGPRYRVPQAGAALIGSVVHAVLRSVEISSISRLSRPAIARLVRQCQTEFDAAGTTLDVKKVVGLIERFVQSPIAAELEKAKQCYRELEFLLRWPLVGTPAAEVAGGLPQKGDRHRASEPSAEAELAGSEPVPLLRGFLDCLFEDCSGRWHLLDYKSDAVTAGEVADRAERYRLQLAVYALAARQLVGDALASARLCFLDCGVAWELELDNELYAWTVERVDKAMSGEERLAM